MSIVLKTTMTTLNQFCCPSHNTRQPKNEQFFADRTNGRAIGTVLRPSSSSSVTLCIVAKRLEQKLLLTACRKSYMRNRLVPK